MPKETKNITLFNAGLITNPDINDIPDNALTTGTVNLKSNAQGKLVPAKGTSALSAISGFDKYIANSGWIKRNDGKYDLVYDDGTDINVIKDFYGTPTHAMVVASKNLEAIALKNEGVHIGVGNTVSSSYPWWVGYINHNQFNNNNASTPLFYEDWDVLASDGGDSSATGYISSVSVSSSTAGTGFDAGTYAIGVSCEYDGFQESPVAQKVLWSPGASVAYMSLTIVVDAFASFNRRVTAINIWIKPKDGLYRFYRRIDINTGDTIANWSLVAPADVNATITTDDIYNRPGESYEAYTGISQEVADYIAYYKLSAELNDHLFVANATSSYHEENPFMLFRSKQGAFSQFDTTVDFLKLPEIPNALLSYNGKLFAFTDNKILRVNFNLFIEDITEGIGAINQKSVVATEYGIFFADKKGVYVLENQVTEISAPIRDLILNASVDIDGIIYDSNEKQILVLFNNEILAFNVLDKTWSKYSITTIENLHHMFNGKDGESYISYEDSNSPTPNQYTDKLFTGSNLTYTAISKEFDMEDPSQEKRFYKLIVDYTGTAPTVQYSTNGGSSFTTLTAVSTGVYEIKSGGDWINAKTIMFKFSGTATINSYSVIFRRFIGRTHE